MKYKSAQRALSPVLQLMTATQAGNCWVISVWSITTENVLCHMKCLAIKRGEKFIYGILFLLLCYLNLWEVFLKNHKLALAGAARLQCCPLDQRVTSVIPSQGTCLGYEFSPWLGALERRLIGVSLPLSPSLLSLKSIRRSAGEDL